MKQKLSGTITFVPVLRPGAHLCRPGKTAQIYEFLFMQRSFALNRDVANFEKPD